MKVPAVEVKCPNCGGCAKFHEPFRFYHARRYGSAPKNAHRWGRLIVEEIFPNDFKWEQPEGETPSFRHYPTDPGEGYLFNHRGMLECPQCRAIEPTEIHWPEAAYWRWIAAGEILVARNREHAKEIYEFLAGSHRPPNRRPSLRSIPSVMLTKQVWPELAQTILRDLVAA
ncbi:hypothetical protein [Alloyangia pacifica]|uniref:hypothetical protein n=1 Tax=Alloyangia pacifica TaxID=311180 RepID=UPI001CFF0E50|nr:hypothetical protein [Alloyangia pacifica]